MVAGSFDEFSGRRTTFDKVYYWRKDETIKDKSKLVLQKHPTGHFYAKKITPKDISNAQIDNAFMFQKGTVTLKSNDMFTLEENDVVKFDNEIWRVANVQVVEEERQEQFMKRISRSVYIRLAK